MKKNKSRKKTAMILNIMIIIIEILGLYHNLISELGIRNLKYYTVLSNIMAMIVSIMFVVHYLKHEKAVMSLSANNIKIKLDIIK